MSVSATLRAALKKDGRSYSALERVCGVSKGQLTRFAKAERSLTLPAVDALAAVLSLELRPVRRARAKRGG